MKNNVRRSSIPSAHRNDINGSNKSTKEIEKPKPNEFGNESQIPSATDQTKEPTETTPVQNIAESKDDALQTPASTMTSSSSFSWARERALEQQIESLRETLKDTEERLHSLRLQYDNVSQMHRTLRETNTQMQEDMERLKIDTQHLRECANILRTELKAARKDRAEAIDLQKLLQRELEDSRQTKKKLSEENEANAKRIMDLQRQCKEMERIMARKNPSAMSSLLCKRFDST